MQRVAVLIGVKDPWLMDDMPKGIRVIAHVSGNQIDILHCPFCGSGAVIGRSDGTVECGYCTSVFTVQVQPQYNGFPQSVDGQPYQWPGQPDPAGTGLAAPDAPPGTDMAPNPADAGANPFGGPPQSSDPADGDGDDSDEDSDDDSGNPFAKGKSKDKDDSKKSDKKDDGKKGKNPFAKKKSYIALNGAELDADNFVAHLAIQFAADPLRVAQAVRERRSRT